MSRVLALAASLVLAVSVVEVASARTPPHAGAASSTTTMSKEAISKACSDQANAKGLHGKARRSFRAACKRRHGQPQ
jgi:hypothetical protein